MIARRGLFAGLGALLAAPAIIRTPGLLMPVRPPLTLWEYHTEWQSPTIASLVRARGRDAAPMPADPFLLGPNGKSWGNIYARSAVDAIRRSAASHAIGTVITYGQAAPYIDARRKLDDAARKNARRNEDANPAQTAGISESLLARTRVS